MKKFLIPFEMFTIFFLGSVVSHFQGWIFAKLNTFSWMPISSLYWFVSIALMFAVYFLSCVSLHPKRILSIIHLTSADIVWPHHIRIQWIQKLFPLSLANIFLFVQKKREEKRIVGRTMCILSFISASLSFFYYVWFLRQNYWTKWLNARRADEYVEWILIKSEINNPITFLFAPFSLINSFYLLIYTWPFTMI